MEFGGKKMMMLFIWFVCLWSSSSASQFESLLRIDYAVQTAPYESSISGPNGSCIRVKNGDYTSGNNIILLECQSTSDFWTFGSDGTLRSNGWCLATSAYTQSSSIIIDKCDTALKNATIWELRNDGLILNPESGFVLTAISGRDGTQLTLEMIAHSSFQTWRYDNHTLPSLVSIVGYNASCLQATDNYGVVLAECNPITVREQWWLLYPDGTIRPRTSSNGCLGYQNVIENKVIVQSCGLAPSSQRWLFTINATIWNPSANLVMDVVQSDSSLKEIVVWPPTGNPNQKWAIIPL